MTTDVFSSLRKVSARHSNFEDFDPWVRALVAEIKPDLIVAVARGAVRCLQLFGPQIPETKILSHTALAFMAPERIAGVRVLVIDDSILFGSTMNDVRQYLIDRGAIVTCAAYVADRQAFLGDGAQRAQDSLLPSPFSTLPVRIHRTLPADQMRRHHATLVRSILAAPLHYNLDFPTFALTGASLEESHLKQFIFLLEHAHFISSVVDVTLPTARRVGNFRLTAFLDPQSPVSAIRGLRLRSIPKLRLSVQLSTGRLTFTPIVQLGMPWNANKEDLRFTSSALQDLWNDLELPCPKTDPIYAQALFRLATAVVGLDIGIELFPRISEAVSPIGLVPLGLDAGDLSLLLGAKNAALIMGFASEGSKPFNGTTAEEILAVDAPTGDTSRKLSKQIVQTIRADSAFTAGNDDPLWEVVGKILLALRSVTDSPEQRHSNPSPSRLDRGLTPQMIHEIGQEAYGLNISDHDLEFCIDFLIDHGLAVPKVVRLENEVLRVYYSGEGEDDQATLQLKVAFHHAYSRFADNRDDRYLAPFDLQKLFVLVAGVLGWLPVTTSPYKFGYVSSLFGSLPDKNWLFNGDSAPCVRKQLGERIVLVPKSDYRVPVAATWDPSDERDFGDAFDFVASAFLKLPDDAKLLLSTCRTHRHTYNAVVFELRAWSGLESSAGGFARILIFGGPFVRGDDSNQNIVLESMYWGIRFISEGLKKHQVFSRQFLPTKARIDRVFERLGSSPLRWWEMVNQMPFLDNAVNPGIEQRMSMTMSLLALAQNLTTCVCLSFLESKALSEGDIARVFADNGASFRFRDFDWLKGSSDDAAEAYNSAIGSRKIPGTSLIKTLIPLDSPIADRLTLCEQCFGEIRSAVQLYCPRYDDEIQFPYAPEMGSRRLVDGSLETQRDNVYLLTLDIVSSTDTLQSIKVKDEIRNVFLQLRTRGLEFQDSGDDSFVAWADEPAVLWDAAVAISLGGRALIRNGQRFGGTRKGLSFGSIATVRRKDGSMFARDSQIPNALPRAFSLLAGVDKFVAEDGMNEWLIIDARTFEKIAAVLQLDPPTREVRVEGKHFFGKAVLVRLLT